MPSSTRSGRRSSKDNRRRSTPSKPSSSHAHKPNSTKSSSGHPDERPTTQRLPVIVCGDDRAENVRFYPGLPVETVTAADLWTPTRLQEDGWEGENWEELARERKEDEES